MGSFLPRTDGGLLTWAQNASTQVSNNALAYGVSTARAAAFATVVTNYATAFAANEAGHRSKATVATKNVQRALLRKAASDLNKLVNSDPTVSDALKYLAGFSVRANPSPRPTPTVAPFIDSVSVEGNTATFRAHDGTGKRGLPAFAGGIVVFSHVGPTPPTDYKQWFYEGASSRGRFSVSWDASLPVLTKAWICVAWSNARDLAGPVCDPISVTLMGTGALPLQSELALAA